MKAEITKSQLIEKLTDWGTKKITSQDFFQWVECNYLPASIDIGVNEPLQTRSAMHSILNAFDHHSARTIIPAGYLTAINFLATSAAKYPENESKFLASCFISKAEHKNSPPRKRIRELAIARLKLLDKQRENS